MVQQDLNLEVQYSCPYCGRCNFIGTNVYFQINDVIHCLYCGEAALIKNIKFIMEMIQRE